MIRTRFAAPKTRDYSPSPFQSAEAQIPGPGTERGAAWLAHQSGGLGVASSNLAAPTKTTKNIKILREVARKGRLPIFARANSQANTFTGLPSAGGSGAVCELPARGNGSLYRPWPAETIAPELGWLRGRQPGVRIELPPRID